MKIKKVEIQAFRAYDKVENGTFDFKRIEDGQYADFVSLYAPNGFGKTSFYDAIEYGYTNNIDRFLKNRNNKDIAKSEKNSSTSKKQYILRNRESNSDLGSFVKVLTDSKEIKRDIEKPRKGASDFKFDEKETENKYFREVILSQDWISGFLKEEKPEDRYKTFIDYFGDKELDKYYNILSSLITQNDKEINKLSTELKGIQLELKFEGDSDILAKVNEKIELLNKTIKLFNKIDSQSSEIEILDLTNVISERLNFIQFETSKDELFALNLDSLVIGNEQLTSFKQFKDNIVNLDTFQKKRQQLSALLTKITTLKEERTKLTSLQEHSKSIVSQKEKKEKIVRLFDKYNEVEISISKQEEEIKGLKSSSDKLNKEITAQKLQKSDLEVQTSTSQTQINEILKLVSELPNIAENIAKTEKSIIEYKTNQQIKNGQLDNELKQIQILENHSNELKISLNNIDNDIFPSEFDRNFEKHTSLLKKRDELNTKLDEENKNLNSVRNVISQQEKFKKELESFISIGLSIVNDQKTDSCPLCNQDYESYKALADKIANNKLLSEESSLLLNKRNEIQNVINSIAEELKKTIISIVKVIKKDISDNDLRLREINGHTLDIRNSITEIKEKLDVENTKLSNLRSSILNKSPEEYSAWAKEHTTKLSETLEKSKANLASLADKLKNNQEQFQITVQKIDFFINEKKEFENDKTRIEIKRFFADNYPNLEIELQLINNDLVALQNKLNENKSKIDESKTSVSAYESQLAEVSENSVKSELNELTNKIDKLSRTIEIYKNNAGKFIELNLDDVDEIHFLEHIQQLKKVVDKRFKEYNKETVELTLLAQLKDNVLPFLKFHETKRRKDHAEERIQFLKTNVGKCLSEEIKKVSQHIEKQIKSFFYEELINDLYRRIDPHPDYKNVKFIPDFKDNKPKLNVCVYKDQDETNFIIPNLYFSHAQLNILSLCIFLAKALNAKDDNEDSIDCIFVDDPIQSMDSINILSTIDLLRSIVVNQKKQIILSTHDENFHNLLKKKIPSDLFNSKFMELETFGKVKPNA